nr:Uncharacterised protein [Raoultella sp. NCTC 9187]
MGQTRTDISAANQHDALVGFLQALQLAHHGTNMLRCGNKEYFIAGFNNGRTLGANRAIVAENSRHTGVDMRHVFTHCRERVAYQRTTVVGFNNRQTYFPFGKVYDLQRAWILNQAVNIVDNKLFRRDQMVNRHGFRVEKLIGVTHVVRRTNAGNTIRRIKQGIGDLAGHHIGFIRTGDGNQHVGIIRSGFAQYARMRAMPLNNTQVKLILQTAQAVTVGINQGNIVVLSDEVFRESSANLSGAQNNNLHQQ